MDINIRLLINEGVVEVPWKGAKPDTKVGLSLLECGRIVVISGL